MLVITDINKLRFSTTPEIDSSELFWPGSASAVAQPPDVSLVTSTISLLTVNPFDMIAMLPTPPIVSVALRPVKPIPTAMIMPLLVCL